MNYATVLSDIHARFDAVLQRLAFIARDERLFSPMSYTVIYVRGHAPHRFLIEVTAGYEIVLGTYFGSAVVVSEHRHAYVWLQELAEVLDIPDTWSAYTGFDRVSHLLERYGPELLKESNLANPRLDWLSIPRPS